MENLFTNIDIILKATVLIAITSAIVGSIVVVKKDTLSTAVISNSEFVVAILIGLILPNIDPNFSHATIIIFSITAIYLAYLTDRYSKLRQVILYPLISSLAFGVALAILTYIDRNILSERIEYSRYLIGSVLNIVSFKESTSVFTVVTLCLLVLFFRKFISLFFNKRFHTHGKVSDRLVNILFFILLSEVIFELNNIVGVLISPAMIVLPAVTARLITKRIKLMVIIAIIISVFSLTLGSFISFILPKITPGIFSVLILGLIFLITMIVNKRLKRSIVGGV